MVLHALGWTTLAGLVFVRVNLVVDLLFDVLHLVDDAVACVAGGGFMLTLRLVGIRLRRVLHVAPGLLGCALYLVGHALVRDAIIAKGVPGLFFHFANCLIDLTADL